MNNQGPVKKGSQSYLRAVGMAVMKWLTVLRNLRRGRQVRQPRS